MVLRGIIHILTTGVVFLSSAKADAATMAQRIPDLTKSAVNLTGDFANLRKFYSDDVEPPELELLREYRVILIAGFLADPVRYLRDLPGGSNLGSYFDAQIRWLEHHGIEMEWPPVDSEQTVEENAKVIAQAIETSPKPVMIFSHSKGGLDTLHALISRPDLKSKVKGWIALNPPFQGSPLANAFAENFALRWATVKALGWLGGSERTLMNMTVDERLDYNRTNALEIEKVLHDVPVLTIASWVSNKPRKIDTVFEITRNYILRQGYINDGAVPWESAVLEGMGFVTIPEVDHATLVSGSYFIPHDRMRSTKACVSLLFRHIDAHVRAMRGPSPF